MPFKLPLNFSMSNRSKIRLYYAAAVCLLVVAAALRFYDLPGNSLRPEEAVASFNSRGGIAEVIENTRIKSTSPILYPLVLYAVQNVEISPLGIRIVPAVASVLTVAALLFLLPRVGVSRWAAFIAALLAAGSVELIRHAQDAREYSIDTFAAVLMIVGLLAYLQERRGGMYVLFCVSLFVAPLVQYGLVLFGIAVFGTIAVMEGRTFWSRRAALREGLRFPGGWGWRRLEHSAWPAVSFAAGCVMSYAVTLRYQWASGGFVGDTYSRWDYYSGGYTDAAAMAEFVLSRTDDLLRYYTAESLMILGLAGFVIFLIVSFQKARLDAVAILLLLSLAVSVCAVLLRIYPYGGTRQSLYLAPIIFLAFGHSLHSIAAGWSSFTPSARLVHAGMGLAAAVVAFSGVSAVRDDRPYADHQNIEGFLYDLEERMQEGDAVYVAAIMSEVVRFYNPHDPSNYYYGNGCIVHEDLRGCIGDILESVDAQTDRLWIMGYGNRLPTFEILEVLHEEFYYADAVHVVVEGFGNSRKLYLIEAPGLFDRLAKPMGSLRQEGELVVSANFDVYLREGALLYLKEPCSPDDAAARFFLHVTPVDIEDLPPNRRQHGFDNLDFTFRSYGMVIDGKCIAIRDIPGYGIKSLGTGQFSEEEGRIWQDQVRFDE